VDRVRHVPAVDKVGCWVRAGMCTLPVAVKPALNVGTEPPAADGPMPRIQRRLLEALIRCVVPGPGPGPRRHQTDGIHRWIRISTQASGSGLGAARGSTPRFRTLFCLPCIAWLSCHRGRVSPRFRALPTASSMVRGEGAAEGLRT